MTFFLASYMAGWISTVRKQNGEWTSPQSSTWIFLCLNSEQSNNTWRSNDEVGSDRIGEPFIVSCEVVVEGVYGVALIGFTERVM